MDLKDLFLQQLETEVAANRKALERVPENQNDWKPHPKSMPLGYLAVLVATMPGWTTLMVDRDQLDLQEASKEGLKPKAVQTRSELVKLLDDSVVQAQKSLKATTEQHLMKNWRMVRGSQVMAEGPRYKMLMNMLFAHLAHHRGQLTVYLRLNDVSVPALYGPSADEQF